MQNSVEFLSDTRVKMTIEVPAGEFKPAYEEAAKVVAKQVNIPGFRPGRVPLRVLEGKIGKGYIIEQAINDNLDNYYQQVAMENDVLPMAAPEVSIKEVPEMKGTDDATALKVEFEVDVRPDFILPNPADFSLEVGSGEVTEEDVDRELDSLRERFATLTSVDRAAKEGDYVNIDLTATIDGEEIDDVAGLSYQIGENSMLDGQDEALTGAKAGEDREFTTKLVGGEHAGEEAKVQVKVHSVKESVLPEADDEFAQLASEFDTIAELRDDLREAAAKSKAVSQIAPAYQQLTDMLLEAADFEIADNVVEMEVANHLENEGKAADDPHADEVRGEVAKALKTQVLLDRYAQAFAIQVSQEELLDFLIAQAQMYGMDPNEFVRAAAGSGQLNIFSAEMARNKALIAALRRANIVDEAGNKVDVTAALGEAPESEQEPDFANQREPRKGPKGGAAKKSAKPAKAAAKESAKESDAEFDPSAHKVDEVIAYVESADEAEKQRVLAAEKAGKARKTILAKLED
ncbi:MAG: trigger factor [Trueperella sp.]|nr:trigger factor [Trueperella sp.]